MLPWLSQSNGSGTGNGIGSQARIYCSMLVLSCTLFLARLHNHTHIHLDPRHDFTSLLRPISPFKFSLQHSLPQRRLVVRAATAVAIPVLSTTIQAAPAIIPHVPLDINLPTHSSSSSASTSTSTSTSTSIKKSTKSKHVASPTPSSNESPSPKIPSPQATGTPNLNDSPPSAVISHAPSQARVGAGSTHPDASSHYSPLTTVSGLSGDSSSVPGTQNGILPNNDSNNISPSTARNSMSPTTMTSASLGCIASMIVLVVGALVVRRRIRNRRRSQVETDFEGLGAYPSGATAGGGGQGKGKQRQEKTDCHVGLTSFESTVSSVRGGRMAMTGIKKPVPLAQREQFWNP